MSNNPFVDPEYLIDYHLKGKDVVERKPDQSLKGDGVSRTGMSFPVGSEGLVAKLGSNLYLFKNIPHNGKLVPVLEFTTKPLCNGESKTQQQWVEFSRNMQANPDGWIVTDAEILFQVMRRAVDLRADVQYRGIVQKFVGELQGLFDSGKPYLATLTKVSYGQELDAVVSGLALFPGPTRRDVKIPELKKENDWWSYVALADEQAENRLGIMNSIPQNACDGLSAILGEGYERTAQVFQYVASRKGGNLREVRFWTPTVTNRNAERVVALGVDSGYRFNLDAINYVNGRPALGVRAQKFFKQK